MRPGWKTCLSSWQDQGAALSGPGMYCYKCVKRAVIARTWVEDVVLLSYVLAYHNREDGFKPGGGANDRKSSAVSAQTGFALFFLPLE